MAGLARLLPASVHAKPRNRVTWCPYTGQTGEWTPARIAWQGRVAIKIKGVGAWRIKINPRSIKIKSQLTRDISQAPTREG